MIIDNGWLDIANKVPSPNFNQRPKGMAIDLLVIHNISLPAGEFGGDAINALFTNRLDPSLHPSFAEIYQLKVSAHLLIRRQAEVMQYVSFEHRAWHAGVSSFQGRENCNDYAIGIELEGTDTMDYELVQYQKLAKITQCLRQTYPKISLDRITGHQHIAPKRKTDPGASFDWEYYFRLIR